MNDKKTAAYRQGVWVFIGLAVLTIFEFFVSAWTNGSAPLLFIIAIAKAAIIANFFMHIYRLWRAEEGH